MAYRASRLLGAAALVILANACYLHGEELPSNPVPITNTPLRIEEPPNAPTLSGPPPPPVSFHPPAPTYTHDNPGQAPLNQAAFPLPGWFVGVDTTVVGPHIKSRLTGGVTVPGWWDDTVQLPIAPLDWTGAPKVEVGYRFCDGFGAFQASFRFLTTEGNGVIPDFGFFSDGLLRTRLDVDVVDLDYANNEFALGPKWDMRWQIGARLGSVYFDSHAVGDFVEERSSNRFFGAGPHAALDLERHLGRTGFSLFSRLDGAVLIGRIRQRFEESITFPDFLPGDGFTEVRTTQAVPVLTAQAGLGYTPCDSFFHFFVGYHIEQWWSIGDAGNSRADLTAQGIFFRAEFNY